MTPDEQEARSLRWGGGALQVLPLQSGRWAIFVGRGALNSDEAGLVVLDDLSASRLRQISEEGRQQYEARRSLERRGREVGMPRAAIEETMEELGL